MPRGTRRAKTSVPVAAMGDIASEVNTSDNRDRALGAAMMALKQAGISVTMFGESPSDWAPLSVR